MPPKSSRPKHVRPARLYLPSELRRQLDDRNTPPLSKEELAARPEIREIEDLVKFLQIDLWDYLLVGDGSATTWDRPGGWACSVIRNAPRQTRLYFGMASHATNILAEMLAYVFPLFHAAQILAKPPKPGKKSDVSSFFPSGIPSNRAVFRLHVVTDCEYVATTGPQATIQNGAHAELWRAVGLYRRKGLDLRWHWIPRDYIPWNKQAHEIANKARIAAQSVLEDLSGHSTDSVSE